MSSYQILTIILTNCKKGKVLPQNIIQTLLNSIAQYSDRAVIVILLIMLEMADKVTIDFNTLSFKLADLRILIEQEDDLQFAERSRDNQASHAVSTLTAKLIEMALLTASPKKMTEATASYLIKALASTEKQTRIFASKCLFLAINNGLLAKTVDYNTLLAVQSYLKDPVSDVAVYSTIFYLENLYQQALVKQAPPMPLFHLSYLSQLYKSDPFRFGHTDFSERINNLILNIVTLEVAKQALPEEIFDILDLIFAVPNDKKDRCLSLLAAHLTQPAAFIPEKIIARLETLLDLGVDHQRALAILCVIIKNGQAVGEKTLTLLAEQLYKSNDPNIRREIFDCLCAADLNQDLPDNLFLRLELQRASISLITDANHYALTVLAEASQAGNLLPLDAFEGLTRIGLTQPHVLAIIKQIVAHEQCLPNHIIEELAKQFCNNADLFKIYFHIVKNNQKLPDDLIEKLQRVLAAGHMIDHVLAIFSIKAQKGDILSKAVIEAVLKHFTNIHDQPAQVDALIVICSVLQQCDAGEYTEQAKQLFLDCLQAKQMHLIAMSTQGLEILRANNKLSQDDMTCIIANLPEDTYARRKLLNLLKKTDLLNQEQRGYIELSTLSCNDDLEYLARCQILSEHAKLLENNFARIGCILTTRGDLHNLALTVLLGCHNAQELPNTILQAIAVIAASSRLTTIKQLAQQLLVNAAVSPKILAQANNTEASLTAVQEQAVKNLLVNNISLANLDPYQQIIQDLPISDLKATVDILSDAFSKGSSSQAIKKAIVECMVTVLQREDIFLLTSRNVLEQALFSRHGCLRGIAFRKLHELSIQTATAGSWKFQQFFNTLQNNIKTATGQLIVDVELLHTLVSLDQVNFPKDKPTSEWTQELILSDWASRFDLSLGQKYQLYQVWVMAKKTLAEPDQVIKALHNSELNFFELMYCLDRIDIIRKMDYRKASQDMYRDIRKIWMRDLLAKKLDLSQLDDRYVNIVLDKMTELPATTIEKLL